MTKDKDKEAGFAYQDHTADAIIQAWGPDCAATLRQVLLALAGMITGGNPVRLEVERRVLVDAADPVAAMVAAANELLYLLDTEGLLAGDVNLQLVELAAAGGVARGPAWAVTVRGDYLHQGDYPTATVPKAATYHEAYLGPGPSSGWAARLIVDL